MTPADSAPSAGPARAGGTDYLMFAQLLRGVAALCVVIAHALGSFWWSTAEIARMLGAPDSTAIPPALAIWVNGTPFGAFWGVFGVALFFLISGLVVPFSLLRLSRGGFVVARVFRLLPTYMAGLLLGCAAAVVCAHWFGQGAPMRWQVLLVQALLLRDLVGWPSLDGVDWTLLVEVKFYLLCLLLAAPIRAERTAAVVAAGVTLFGVAAWLGWALPGVHGLAELAIFTLPLLGFMLIGVLFHLHHRGGLSTPGLLAGAALLMGAFMLTRPVGGAAEGRCYAAALLLFAGLYAARRRIRRGPWLLRGLAEISYPLYASHALILYAVLRVTTQAGWAAVPALAVALCVVLTVAVLLHLLVERPSQRLGRRLARGAGPAPSGQACAARSVFARLGARLAER